MLLDELGVDQVVSLIVAVRSPGAAARSIFERNACLFEREVDGSVSYELLA